MRRKLPIRTPVRARLTRLVQLLERDRQVEVGIGVERVEAERLLVARLCLAESSEVVMDVPEVEMGLEEVRLDADGSIV